MEPNPKFVKLLSSLKEATSAGRIKWTDTVDAEMFRVVLDRAVVRIGRVSDDESNDSSISALLLDSRGGILDSISSSETDDRRILTLLHELYDLARRRSERVDDLLDSLISSVEARGPVT